MTNKLKGIIIDDEKNGRDVLKNLLAAYCSAVEIISEAGNIADGYNLIKSMSPDFILLDIQMPGGNGFELLKKFNTINFEIIFVTSYDKYAINAFKFSAIDYLLKPVEIDDLISAIERLRNKRNSIVNSVGEKFIYLLNNVSNDDALKNIALQKNDKVFYINISEIIYFEAEGNYTKIITVNDETFIHAKTLKYFEDIFSDKSLFLRITRSYMVNLKHIKYYTKSEPCMLTMSNRTELEISRRKKSELISLMNSL